MEWWEIAMVIALFWGYYGSRAQYDAFKNADAKGNLAWRILVGFTTPPMIFALGIVKPKRLVNFFLLQKDVIN